MKQGLAGAFCLLFSAAATFAQGVPARRHSPTRWLLDSETGSQAGLGFKDPHFAAGPSFEKALGPRFELQGSVHYSPDRKIITKDGNSLRVQGQGIFWTTWRLGISGSLRHSNLWTSQFNKSAFGPAAGVVIREQFQGMPGRLYVDFLLPTGCEWGPSCRMQSNRMKGPEVYWEHRVWTGVRLGLHVGIYHFLNQSNNLRPDLARLGQWTGDTSVLVRFEFPRASLENYY